MKVAQFDYVAPVELEEALGHLSQNEDARVIAGGQSLVPLMAFRLAEPSLLVDLRRIAGLREVAVEPSHVTLGAMVTQAAAGRLPGLHPLVHEAIPLIAHPQIRNRGTVGGSIAHADPAAELPAVAVALDCEIGATSSAGERWVRAREFFVSLFSTALEPGEILTSVRFPVPQPGEGWAIQEVARRPGDFALAGVVARLILREGTIADAAIVTFAVGDRPALVAEAGRSLVGSAPVTEAFAAAARTVEDQSAPPSDIHGSDSYRRRALRVMVERALRAAAHRTAEAA